MSPAPAPEAFLNPIFFGNVVNWLLLGYLIVQLYVFHKGQLGRKDALWLRLLVYTVVAVDIIETGLGTHDVWYFAVQGWGNVDRVKGRQAPWSGKAINPLSGFVILSIQSLYSWRVWSLSRKIYFRALACMIVSLSFMQFGAALAVPFLAPNILSSAFSDAISIWLIGSFTGDVLIAACMITLLAQARGQALTVHSQTLYERLIVITISTGLVTAIVAGVNLALFVHDRDATDWESPDVFLSKLYTISFLSALNDRLFRREESIHDVSTDFDANSNPSITSRIFQRVAKHRNTAVTNIHVLSDCERNIDSTIPASNVSISLESQAESTSQSNDMDGKPPEMPLADGNPAAGQGLQVFPPAIGA
ncbi:hypothetical protein PENSPDRAFT_755780 [Peniophora sp. CONT]|nr:hypothetical protein PENSPDRAFT_755780 [Peniophora sp. CONT]